MLIVHIANDFFIIVKYVSQRYYLFQISLSAKKRSCDSSDCY